MTTNKFNRPRVAKIICAAALVGTLMVGACAPTSQRSTAQWDLIAASRNVAKVTNIKSLEQPGLY